MNRSILFLVILVSSICNVANGQCPYGTYATNPAVSWVSNGNLDSYTTISENTQNDTGGKLYSDGANVVYSSSTSFQAGDVITIRGNYQNDSRRGPLVLTSVGSAALNSGSVMNNAFPANAWGDVTYTIPAGTTSFSQLNITGATDNGVYVNIDVVKITRAACYTCDINVAPVLSAPTVSNVCPANTFNLNSITASNTPAGAELTWHTGTPATNANRIASPGTASGFRFYAAFHSIANNCYSGVNGAATTVVNTDGDSDCDGIPNNIDLDDDNDGIPDKVECPSYFKNLTGSRGFSDATAPSNWYYANSSSNFDVSTSAAITYGSTNKNSTLTGGLFDEIDGINTTGGLQNVLVENPEPVALVCKLSEMLVAGASYEYAFDLGARSTGNTSHHYYVKVFNADLDIVVDTLESGLLSSLPLYASSPNFKNFAGTFTVPSTGNYYLLFTTEGAGNSDDDYLIDRVAMRGEVNLCDTDGDGIPNLLDLDSDNDGCPDLKEAGVSPLTDVITPSTALAGSFGIAPGALAGSQLNPSAADANNDGLNDSVDPDTNGTPNYTSTYAYAISTADNYCIDTDGDGIPDVIDLDDDNDGVLDTEEMICRSGSGSPAISGNNITITDNNEFSYYENSSAVTINYPYSFQKFNILFWSIDYQDNFTVSVKLDDGTVVGPLDGRVFYSNTDPSWVSRWTTKGYPVASSNTNWNQLLGKYTGTPFNTGEVFYTSPITNNLNKAWGAVEFTVPQATATNGIDKIIITIKPGIGVTAFAEVEPLNIISGCTDLDTDGDGIPNRLDLDSDADGCPDAVEAGVASNPSTAGSMSASGGAVYSGGIAAGTPNAYVGNGTNSQYGSNGFFNNIESGGAGSGIYNSTYSYNHAIAKSYSVCKDSDNDGINDLIDLDDDNDGILDAIESPSCFYTSAEMAVPLSVTTQIPTTSDITNLYDNNTLTIFSFTSTTAANALAKTIFEITPPLPQAATSIILNLTSASSPFGALNATSTMRAEGWNGTTWVPLATYTAAPTITSNTMTFAFSNTTVYSKYRLYESGTSGVAVNTNSLQEVKLGIPAGYIASANPKPTCSVDTDGDGIPNHQDLDSDGDGCSDASETGVTGTLLPGMMVNNSGIVYSPSAIAQGPYGINGFANPLETSTSPESGVYTGSYSNYSNATNSSIHTCAVQPQPKPDINVGYVNDVIRGNLSVNDVIPAGSTYGSLTLVPEYTNPGNEMPVVNSDGTYTFTAATPGIYQFYVSVCPPSVSTGCQPVLLTIEVLNGYVETNKPVASPDFATVKMNQPVTLKTLSNDRAGNNYTTLQPSSVTITALPKNGTATVNTTTGDITYTPASGFTGQDTLSYSVCDDGSPSANCNTSYQIITVLPATAANSVTASDDYLFVPQGTTGSGNVLTNDYDPEGNTLTVTPQTLTVDEGKLTLLSNGSFTFEAAGSFTGAVNFPYDVCDNGSPVACTRATIYILVPSASTLPLELLTFTAVKENSSTTGLRWTTASEINTSHFVIERMINGSGRWEAIGRVNTTGNGGTSVNSYYFPDRQPAAGINYYRLMQVDEDGRYKYSHVCLVSYGDTKINTSIYPNPADDYAIIQGLELSHATIHIYDALGQQLDGMIRVEQVSLHQLKVQLYRLTPGMYIIKVNGQALKLLKK